MCFGRKKRKEKKLALEEQKKLKEKQAKEASEKPVTTKPSTADTKAKAPASGENQEVYTIEQQEEEIVNGKKVSSTKIYHISKRQSDSKWQVKYGGGSKAIKLFDTQAEAIKFAKEKAVNQEGAISIHKKDGKIRKQDYKK